ncbi:MAG: ubiquinone/menaquinone biosynthesis methyltransferase [Candidatus Eisenbacteria bacterium]
MPDPNEPRFRPHAAEQMATMFDDVSGRYDFLNRVMTLGQDGAWREAMWRCVPDAARTVLDLCTGSGVSLDGLRRPGRTLLGMDVSLQMLRVAAAAYGARGWGPRIACADAFHLPLRTGSLDAVTIAFGVRNLRPRISALTEIGRALRAGGKLVVLEAAAPAPGMLKPFHSAWVRHMIPIFGRLSPDPSAYRYLSASIFEFGAGPEFERDLATAGFEVVARQSFLLGATRLWVACRIGQKPSAPDPPLQGARSRSGETTQVRSAGHLRGNEARIWLGFQAGLSLMLCVTLMWGLGEWLKYNTTLPLTEAQRFFGWLLLSVGLMVFGVRAVYLGLRFLAGASAR